MYLLYEIHTRNGSRTDFVKIPDSPKVKQYQELYEKLYGKAYAYSSDMVWRPNENRWGGPNIVDIKEKLTPDCFLDSDARFSYQRRGLKKELTATEYTINVGSKKKKKKEEIVYPTEMAVGLSQKEWDLLIDLWDESEYDSVEDKTSHFKKKHKRYLQLIDVIKSNDFVQDMIVCDIIM